MNAMMKAFFNIEYWCFALMCLASVFANTYQMTDTNILPKWYFTTAVLLVGICFLSVKLLLGKKIKIEVSAISFIIINICLVQAVYGIGQWMHWLSINSGYEVTGSFDNPAGFASCLCVSLPFAILYREQVGMKLLKNYACGITLILFIAILLSMSRTGIFCVILVFIIVLYRQLPLKSSFKFFFSVAFLILFIGVSYYLKKDSADGRLLIWKSSWEMVKNTPFWGNGLGTFRAHYMDYQADFFEKYPNSQYAILADNVLSPFNEYLSVILQFGIMGLLILLFLVFILIYCYRRQPCIEKKVALLSLLSIAVFAFFSYPFTYPFTWIIVCLDIYILLKGCFRITVSVFYRDLLCCFLIISSSVTLFKLCRCIDAEYKWKAIAYQHPTDEILSRYKDLLPIMGENPFFLYNYSIALFDAGYLDESLEKARQCRYYWADYDLELLLGNICKRKKKYVEAEKYYRKASFMCPCRFVPLHQLFEIYGEMGEMKKKCDIALMILEKIVKVNSRTVMQIRYKAAQFLKKEDSCERSVK